MKYWIEIRSFLIATLLFSFATLELAAQNNTGKLVVPGEVDSSKLIPISMSGFSGEVSTVLKFDLEIMGFKFEGPDTAQYLLSGSNSDRVEGRLSDRINKASLLAKAYTGGTQRSQAHALADDIVLAITRKKGIAQTKIAFKVDTGGRSEIYIADFDGYNPQIVTKDNNLVAAPCWTPGRFGLFYTSYKAGYPEIFAHDLSTGARQAVARFGSMNTSAAPSPDGKRLAFISNKGGAPNVYVCDADGGNLKRLTTSKEGESSPCWSPDVQTICFASRAGGKAALYTVSASGGAMKRLTAAGVSGNLTEPDWSPDGRTIVFTAQMGAFNICTVPAGGGMATVLVAGQDPCWAPNSRTVIFVRGRGDLSLSLLDVPTKQTKNVSRVSGSNSQPSWAR